MKQETHRVWSAAQPALSAGCLRSLGLLVFLSVPAAAQGTRLVVSTTDDVAPTAGIPFPVTDGDLVVVESGQPVTPFLAGGHFLATCGFVPGDVDAFAHLPAARPGSAEGTVFSLLSNEGGFLDGDILALKVGGGAALVISELDLATQLGAPGAAIDVDALAYDDQGRILFSLADNLAASSLGALSDGDVLRLEPAQSGVTLLLTEAEAQARFTAATGLTDAILDVQALDWVGGELWAAVQSPSRHDGSILVLDGTVRVVFDENDMGLGGGEVDALGGLRPGDERPVFHMSPDQALPGDLVHIETRGRPGAVLFVLLAGKTGFVDWARHPGFGGWYLDRFDPWLTSLSAAHALPFVVLDGSGRFSTDWRLPTSTVFGAGLSGELGWSFQAFEFGSLELSAPFRVQKL